MKSAHATWHDRAPAPGRLALVQELVNTRDLEEGVDRLADLASARVWLLDQRLLDPTAELVEADRARLTALREAIRALLLANSGLPVDPAAVALLNAEVARSALRPRFDARGRAALAASATGLDRAIGILLAAIVEATANGDWLRLKVCGRESCRWAFWDASRSRAGRWCTMSICGNRAKVGAYRRRQSAASTKPLEPTPTGRLCG
jgi:predicted RNA-binding Zn ribbon-like protein